MNNSQFPTLNSQLKTILLVEDDVNLNKINRLALESEGYTVHAAFTLAQAREILTIMDCEPDLILLDVKLPDGSGYDFCKELRNEPNSPFSIPYSQFSAVPVLFLTSVTDSAGEMEGLRVGGTDYIRKPYDIDLLRMRVANLLKLQESKAHQAIEEQKREQKNITVGAISIDTLARRVYVNGEDLNLQPKEYVILLLLIQNKDKAVSADELYRAAWKMPMLNNAGAIQFQISNLRKKLMDSGCSILTKRKEGYIFEQE